MRGMRMQGFPSDLLDIMELSQDKGMELAGNAFCGYVTNPLLCAALMHDSTFGGAQPLPGLTQPSSPRGSPSVSSDAGLSIEDGIVPVR